MWKIQAKWQESGNLISAKILVSEVKAWGEINKQKKAKFLAWKKRKLTKKLINECESSNEKRIKAEVVMMKKVSDSLTHDIVILFFWWRDIINCKNPRWSGDKKDNPTNECF